MVADVKKGGCQQEGAIGEELMPVCSKPTERLLVRLIVNPRWFTDQFAASDEATGSREHVRPMHQCATGAVRSLLAVLAPLGA